MGLRKELKREAKEAQRHLDRCIENGCSKKVIADAKSRVKVAESMTNRGGGSRAHQGLSYQRCLLPE